MVQLDTTAEERFGQKFVDLKKAQHAVLCEAFAVVKSDAVPDDTEAGRAKRALQNFFRVFRNLTAGGFYTTPEGMKDVGYTGNVALAAQPKPPVDLLAKLGLE